MLYLWISDDIEFYLLPRNIVDSYTILTYILCGIVSRFITLYQNLLPSTVDILYNEPLGKQENVHYKERFLIKNNIC